MSCPESLLDHLQDAALLCRPAEGAASDERGLPGDHPRQPDSLSNAFPLAIQLSHAYPSFFNFSQPVICALSFSPTCNLSSPLPLQKCSLSETSHHWYPLLPLTCALL